MLVVRKVVLHFAKFAPETSFRFEVYETAQYYKSLTKAQIESPILYKVNPSKGLTMTVTTAFERNKEILSSNQDIALVA